MTDPKRTPRPPKPTALFEDLALLPGAAPKISEQEKQAARRILRALRIELSGILILWAGVNPEHAPLMAKKYADDMEKINPL